MSWQQLSENVIPLEQAEELDRTFAKCFSTKAGRTVLEHLRKITIEQPTWSPGEDPSHGYAREGQNSIIRDIERRIIRARNTDG